MPEIIPIGIYWSDFWHCHCTLNYSFSLHLLLSVVVPVCNTCVETYMSLKVVLLGVVLIKTIVTV